MAADGGGLWLRVRKEFVSARSADEVWALLRRFDAVHELAKGFVSKTQMEPSGARLVTLVNGMQVREWLVSSDDAERRLVYAILDHPRFDHHSAAAQVLAEGTASRFVWTVDFLSDEMAGMQGGVHGGRGEGDGRRVGLGSAGPSHCCE
jgi:hypothetical protein